MTLQLQSIMSTRIVSVAYDDKLSEVKQIFDSMKFHHVLVVEHGKLHGVISDRDLLRALSPFIGKLAETARDAGTLDKRAHQIMSRDLVTLPPDASVADAVDLFLTRSISCLPVVDSQQRPVGIVSWRDVLRALRPE